MEITETDITTFERDKKFYGELDIAFTIKSFELSAIRKRYLESKKRGKSRTGSVERRKTANGGIAAARLSDGCLKDFTVLADLPEPRAIDITDDVVAFSSENIVYVILGRHLKTISNPWFSYIHTVSVSENKILISSSGFDAVFEYDLQNGQKLSEWFAWENGFNKGFDPDKDKELLLTRDEKLAGKYEKEGKDFLLISHPLQQVLPTAQRAAFINSVVYDACDLSNIIATFFHEGALFSIDLRTGEPKKILTGLKNPHGGMRHNEFYAATSTATGEFVIGNLSRQQRINFSNLPGKSPELGDLEWIQNTKFHDGNFISIDSNRNCFIIFNLDRKVYDLVEFDGNLAIQDLAIAKIPDYSRTLIKSLNQPSG